MDVIKIVIYSVKKISLLKMRTDLGCQVFKGSELYKYGEILYIFVYNWRLRGAFLELHI